MTFCLIINLVTRLALYSGSIVIWQEKTTIYFWSFAGKKCIWRHLEALLKRTCGVAPDYTMTFCLNILWTLLPWLCPTWPGCTQVFLRVNIFDDFCNFVFKNIFRFFFSQLKWTCWETYQPVWWPNIASQTGSMGKSVLFNILLFFWQGGLIIHSGRFFIYCFMIERNYVFKLI